MATAADQLRDLLGETIPEGGEASDTLFTQEQIEDYLLAADGDLNVAALSGWRVKSAALANLVDVTDGAASRSMGQLLDNALKQVKIYEGAVLGPSEGRTRIGRIVRT